MKIETDDNTANTVQWVSLAVCISAVVLAIAWMTYRYNMIVYEKGYTQQQLIGNQNTMWIKP